MQMLITFSDNCSLVWSQIEGDKPGVATCCGGSWGPAFFSLSFSLHSAGGRGVCNNCHVGLCT